MRRMKYSSLLGYGLALLATLFAESMAVLIAPYFPQSPFILFVFAVVVSSWFGGRGPGLFATVLGTGVTAYLSLVRLPSRTTTTFDELIWLTMSVLVILLINSLLTIRKQGQETLLRLAAIVEFSDEAIIGQDATGAIVSWNSGAQKIYGYSAEEVTEHSVSMLVPPDLQAEFATRLKQARRGEHLRLESRHLRKDGQRIDVSLVLSPIKDVQSKVTGISMIARDISAGKRAQIEREKLFAAEQAARAQAEATSQHLSAVQAITDAALAHLTLDDLLHELLTRVRTLLSGDVATILLLTEDREHFAVRASSALEQASQSVHVLADAALAARIAETNEPLVVEDLAAVETPSPLLRQRTGSMIGVPLCVEGNVIGVLHVGTLRRHRFTEEDLQLLQVVADRVALAIDHARLFGQVRAAVARLQILSQRLMEAQELERRALARELHDEIGQALTALKINLQTARRAIAAPQLLVWNLGQPSGGSVGTH
jgi:PAS domain S-box-containing protein